MTYNLLLSQKPGESECQHHAPRKSEREREYQIRYQYEFMNIKPV